MGNLHTTNTMLQGTVKDIRRESLKAIKDAGVGGGFVLSTGDQCGRDTPDENILEMVRVCKEFGKYPLNIEAVNETLETL
jgi:uroporphyrinogen decarboxylase